MNLDYFYSTAQGKATVHHGDDKPLRQLGKYANETEARKACEKHFEKAKRISENMGYGTPKAHWL